MGAIIEMNVKCYNYTKITQMLGIWENGFSDELDKFLKLIRDNDVVIFQPPKSPGSGRARKRPETYLKANSWLDQYMKEQNTWAALKGKRIVKHGYKKYEPEQNQYNNQWQNLYGV